MPGAETMIEVAYFLKHNPEFWLDGRVTGPLDLSSGFAGPNRI
jgi:hypothetical protein